MSNRTRLSLDHRELLFALDELVRLKPNELIGNPTTEHHDWVGRARTLIGAWDESQEPAFRRQTDLLFPSSALMGYDIAYGALASIMNTIQEARNELRLITGGRVSGAFDAGQPFDFYDELRKIIETAQSDVLFVDRYMGADFVSSYLPHVRAGVSVRLLTRNMLDTLKASVAALVRQNPMQIEIRSAQNFHGRFLCLDRSRAFIVDASFKDAAKSAPAALIELTDNGAVSIGHYEAIWAAGTPVGVP